MRRDRPLDHVNFSGYVTLPRKCRLLPMVRGRRDGQALFFADPVPDFLRSEVKAALLSRREEQDHK